jgi:hypothetical protein
MNSVRLVGVVAAMALMVTLGGCGDDDAPPDPGFAGHWTSTEWGEHYIVVEGSTMKIIYTHDDGRAVGTLSGTTFTGWWTESPSREGPRDAGEVEFTISGTGDTRKVDGVWNYGDAGTVRENWDLTWVGDEVPADVAVKFAEDGLFIAHP